MAEKIALLDGADARSIVLSKRWGMAVADGRHRLACVPKPALLAEIGRDVEVE